MSEHAVITQEIIERLKGVEAKLDRMSEAFIALARVDEKIVTLFHSKTQQDVINTDLNTRLTNIEKDNAKYVSYKATVQKISFCLIVFLSGFAGTNFGKVMEAAKVLVGG